MAWCHIGCDGQLRCRFAPVHDHQHDWLIGLMEGVEDIPGAALSEALPGDGITSKSI